MAVNNKQKSGKVIFIAFFLFSLKTLAEENEYTQKVIFDDVSLVIATENNMSPSSAMGHSFLKISGNGYEHAFSYYAVLDGFFSYLKTLAGIADGAYILSPYAKKASDYLLTENRSLWEFELNLNKEEKSKLKQLIWEKKDKNDSYSFISYNCSSALENLLSFVNKDFKYQRTKLFTTPVEYAQFLYQKEKIKKISFVRSPSLKKQKVKNILKSKPPSRLALETGYIEFSPVYQDLRSISDAHNTEMETKMLAVRLSFKDEVHFDKLDLLTLLAVQPLSKYLNIGYEHGWKAEFGIGKGYDKNRFSCYALAIGGGRKNNAFIGIQTGIIQRFSDKAKAILSYETSTDKNIFSVYFGISLGKNTEIYTQYRHDDNEEGVLGLALYF